MSPICPDYSFMFTCTPKRNPCTDPQNMEHATLQVETDLTNGTKIKTL